MKKILALAIVALLSFQVQAQHNDSQESSMNHRGHKKMKMMNYHSKMMKDLDPESMATLETKRMVLHLDLDKAQQKSVYKINLKKIKAQKDLHKDMEKSAMAMKDNPTGKQLYKKMNARLDQQIALQSEMKSVLTPEQFKKWKRRSGVKVRRRGANCEGACPGGKKRKGSKNKH